MTPLDALGSAWTRPPVTPPADAAAARKAAEEFEAVFLNTFLGAMFEGIATDGPFGGGPGEQVYRSLLIDQYATTLAKQGGLGLSDAITRELMALQETGR